MRVPRQVECLVHRSSTVGGQNTLSDVLLTEPTDCQERLAQFKTARLKQVQASEDWQIP